MFEHQKKALDLIKISKKDHFQPKKQIHIGDLGFFIALKRSHLRFKAFLLLFGVFPLV